MEVEGGRTLKGVIAVSPSKPLTGPSNFILSRSLKIIKTTTRNSCGCSLCTANHSRIMVSV